MRKKPQLYTAIINNEELLFKSQEIDEDLYTYKVIPGSEHTVILTDISVTLKLKKSDRYVLEYQENYMGITYSLPMYSNVETRAVTYIRDYVSMAIITDK